MATLDALDKKHREYIDYLIELFEGEGFDVDNWGLESTAPNIRASGINSDFSLPALELRGGFDLLVRGSLPTTFICEADGKTTMSRVDTGNIAIEVYPVLFGRQSKRPRLLVFQDVNDKALWADTIPDNRLNSYFLPDRWTIAEALQHSRNIQSLLPGARLYVKDIPWNRRTSSGDPFYLWKISWIDKVGSHAVDAIRERFGNHRTPTLAMVTPLQGKLL